MKQEDTKNSNIQMTIASIIGLALIISLIYFSSDLYPGSALEAALTLRNGITWPTMIQTLLISALISFIFSLVIFWVFTTRKYDSEKNEEIFITCLKFSLTVVLVISLLLFFDKTQFGIIASGLSIWALLSTVFKNKT